MQLKEFRPILGIPTPMGQDESRGSDNTAKTLNRGPSPGQAPQARRRPSCTLQLNTKTGIDTATAQRLHLRMD